MFGARFRPRLEELETRLALSANHGTFALTATGVHLYSDQIVNGQSDKMVRFLATHFDGAQKLGAGENARYLAVNPNWALLHYRLATASGPAPYIHNGTWNSDWSAVTAREDWFMHNAAGQRLHNSEWNWDLNDINNPSWRQYWLNSVIADMRATGSEGVFADSYTAGIGGWGFDQTDARFAGANAASPSAWPGGATWLIQLKNLADYMKAGLAATPEHFLYVPNAGNLITSWANLDLSNADGAWLEGFGEVGAGFSQGDASDWALSMNRALQLVAADKIVISEPRLDAGANTSRGLQERGYYLATYLLLKGNHTYLSTQGDRSTGGKAFYYPEDGVDLGSALTPMPTDVSGYLWNGVYRRVFQNGIVVVNPGTANLAFDLGRTYRQLTFSGGGELQDSAIDAAGNYVGGSMSTTPVNQVVVAPGSAVILLNPVGDSSGGGTTVASASVTVGVYDNSGASGPGIQWYLRAGRGSGPADAGTFLYGAPGWKGLVGDWNGDGVDTVAAIDPSRGTWYMRNSNSAGGPDVAPFAYGLSDWTPLAGDWTHTGRDGIGMYDPRTSAWYLRSVASSGGADVSLGAMIFGQPGWVPVVGDWNGDGTDTIGAFDPSTATWYLANSNSSGTSTLTPFRFGAPGWQPVVGDWNGDGVTTIGVIDPAGRWYLRNGNNAGAPDAGVFSYGAAAWTAVPGLFSASAKTSRPADTGRPIGTETALAADPLRTTVGAHSNNAWLAASLLPHRRRQDAAWNDSMDTRRMDALDALFAHR